MKKHLETIYEQDFSKYNAKVQAAKEDASTSQQNCAKRKGSEGTSITNFFGNRTPYRKSDSKQQQFLTNMVLLIAKGCISLSMCDSPWLRTLVLQCDSKINFPSRRSLMRVHIPNMLAKTMELYVLPSLSACATASITFDLWMSRAGYDTFALIVNFIDNTWVPCHICIRLFETSNTSGAALVEIVTPLIKKFDLVDKVITCIKDEGSNLSSLENALSTVASCSLLNITPYAGVCWGHVMSKVC